MRADHRCKGLKIRRFAVDPENHVSRFQARLSSGSAGNGIHDQNAFARKQEPKLRKNEALRPGGVFERHPREVEVPHEGFAVSLEFDPNVRAPRLLKKRRVEVRHARNRPPGNSGNAIHAVNPLRFRLRTGRRSHIGRKIRNSYGARSGEERHRQHEIHKGTGRDHNGAAPAGPLFKKNPLDGRAVLSLFLFLKGNVAADRKKRKREFRIPGVLSPDNLTHADGKAPNGKPEPLGGEIVAALVNEHNNADRKKKTHDGQKHR